VTVLTDDCVAFRAQFIKAVYGLTPVYNESGRNQIELLRAVHNSLVLSRVVQPGVFLWKGSLEAESFEGQQL
jgi:hypothetical protein